MINFDYKGYLTFDMMDVEMFWVQKNDQVVTKEEKELLGEEEIARLITIADIEVDFGSAFKYAVDGEDQSTAEVDSDDEAEEATHFTISVCNTKGSGMDAPTFEFATFDVDEWQSYLDTCPFYKFTAELDEMGLTPEQISFVEGIIN